jgi:hypothetical protein
LKFIGAAALFNPKPVRIGRDKGNAKGHKSRAG